MSINLVLVLGAFVTLLVSILGAVYRYQIRPHFQLYFGGEIDRRRDYDAERRLKQFEWRCGQVVLWCFGSGFFGFLQGFLEANGFEPRGYLVLASFGCLVVAGLFLLWAYSRWRNPYEN